MECVFPVVIWSEFRMVQYRDDDHWEDAPHFIIIKTKIFIRKLSLMIVGLDIQCKDLKKKIENQSKSRCWRRKVMMIITIVYLPIMWFRQMAQLSTTISQAQRATAFHFFTSNLFLSLGGLSTSILAILKITISVRSCSVSCFPWCWSRQAQYRLLKY